MNFTKDKKETLTTKYEKLDNQILNTTRVPSTSDINKIKSNNIQTRAWLIN